MRKAKGEIIGSGVSGIVELVSSERVSKSPWPGSDAELCRKDICLEAEIYHKLGDSRYYPRFFGYDSEDGSITLEYMKNGTLREYLRNNHDQISVDQRLEWAFSATEGLRGMHSHGILHCDFSPRNLLLDESLQVKVADFGGCSVNGSWSSAMGSPRFQQPRPRPAPPTVSTDVFSLGSTLYEIMTGKPPYEDVSSAEVKQLYQDSQFPNLDGICGGEVIRSCWLLKIKSLDEVLTLIEAARMSSVPVSAATDMHANSSNLP